MTAEEKRELAVKIFKGDIFTSAGLETHEITTVFVLLSMMEPEQVRVFAAQQPYVIYEEISKAMPLSCNNKPVFMSFNSLNQADWQDVRRWSLNFSKQWRCCEQLRMG